MTSLSEESLSHYFEELCQIRDQLSEPVDASDLDELARICIKISGLLVDDIELARMIAKELSLIVDFDAHASAEEDLFVAMHDIDQNLDENLRGFSSLMELIVEDTRIRRDPATMLFAIEQREPRLAKAFSLHSGALEALLNFEEAFCLDFPKAACLIFLYAMRDVHRHLSNCHETRSQEIIGQWLVSRVKSETLATQFEHAQRLCVSSFADESPSFLTRDVMVVVLCFWSAQFRVLSQVEATIIDKILCSMGMDGIDPLVQAGFLELEGCGKDGLSVVSQKILLAT